MQSASTDSSEHRRHENVALLIVYAAFVGVCVFLFHTHGVKIVNDSHRYLEYADQLKNGFYFDQHNFWYFGYALFLFCIRVFSTDAAAIIGIQYLLSGVAVFCIFRTSILLFKKTGAGIAAALCYIFFIEILSWNSYVLCESLFSSLTCISFYLLIRIYKNNRDTAAIAIVLLVIPLTVLTKPTGIALLCALFATGIHYLFCVIKKKAVRFILAFVIMGGILLIANMMLTTYTVMENYALGEVVYGILGTSRSEMFLSIPVPDDLEFPPEGYPPLLKILSFIFHNPLYWIKLFTVKVFYFLVHVRPYWSWSHNVYSVAFLLPLYALAVRMLVDKSTSKSIAILFTTYLVVHIASVGITSVDWDGRFLMPLLPAVFLIASNEAYTVFVRIASQLLEKRRIKSE